MLHQQSKHPSLSHAQAAVSVGVSAWWKLGWFLILTVCGLPACESAQSTARPENERLAVHGAALTALPETPPSSTSLPNGTPLAPDEFHRRVLVVLDAEGVSRVRELSPQGKLAIEGEIAKTPVKAPAAASAKQQAAYAEYLKQLSAPGATAQGTAAKKAMLLQGAP